MKVTFIFSDSADLSTLTSDDLYQTHFDFPDTGLQLPNIKEQVLALANLVGHFTYAVLHVTCPMVELKNYPVKLEKTSSIPIQVGARDTTVLRFRRASTRQTPAAHMNLTIAASIPPNLPSGLSYQRRYTSGFVTVYFGQEHSRYTELDLVYQMADLCLSLLNEQVDSTLRYPPQVEFDPRRTDFRAVNRAEKIGKKRKRTFKKLEKQREQQNKSLPGNQASTMTPTTGAGRRVGAVPGVFKGIQFRSQLEIRFVTQLEAKQIRWIYEGERLGEGNYLVDFYLPDLKCWVEVKGKVEPRDDYLLKDVADYLKRERHEKLFIYTQSKAFAVSNQSFRTLTHDEFWARLS